MPLAFLDASGSLASLRLNFSPESLLALNACLALIMFGVALNLRQNDFDRLLARPAPAVVGFLSQFLLLPLLTLALIWIVRPQPGLALGMMLVAVCPGGNISNFITALGRGNVALSVTLTTIATIAAILLTPIGFAIWSGWLPGEARLPQNLAVDISDMLGTVLLVIGLPILAGSGLARWRPSLAKRLNQPMRWISLAIFVAFIGVALVNNWQHFLRYIGLVVGLVALHNALAFAGGYGLARLMKLSERDCRAIAAETGLQNSGLGLVLIFTFFGGHGGMALVAATWGVWHLISGLILGLYWQRRIPPEEVLLVQD